MTGRMNFTYATNEYLELDEKDYPDEYLKRAGHNINQHWGLVAERLFVEADEVDNSPEQDFGRNMAGDIAYTEIDGHGLSKSNSKGQICYPTVHRSHYQQKKHRRGKK